jgi:hypothetical protein
VAIQALLPTINLFQFCFSFISGISAILTQEADQDIEELTSEQEIRQPDNREKESKPHA